MSRLDRWMENSSRALARRSGRRGFLARLGRVIAGGTVAGAVALPLLPVARGQASDESPGPRAAAPPEDIEGPAGDPNHCDYWRNCAIDGFLCGCCGGSGCCCGGCFGVGSRCGCCWGGPSWDPRSSSGRRWRAARGG